MKRHRCLFCFGLIILLSNIVAFSSGDNPWEQRVEKFTFQGTISNLFLTVKETSGNRIHIVVNSSVITTRTNIWLEIDLREKSLGDIFTFACEMSGLMVDYVGENALVYTPLRLHGIGNLHHIIVHGKVIDADTKASIKLRKIELLKGGLGDSLLTVNNTGEYMWAVPILPEKFGLGKGMLIRQKPMRIEGEVISQGYSNKNFSVEWIPTDGNLIYRDIVLKKSRIAE